MSGARLHLSVYREGLGIRLQSNFFYFLQKSICSLFINMESIITRQFVTLKIVRRGYQLARHFGFTHHVVFKPLSEVSSYQGQLRGSKALTNLIVMLKFLEKTPFLGE